MIKMIAAVWILAAILYILTYTFYESPNKKLIMKRAGIALGFVSVAIIILTLITILL